MRMLGRCLREVILTPPDITRIAYGRSVRVSSLDHCVWNNSPFPQLRKPTLFYLNLFNCFYRAFSLSQCCNFNMFSRYVPFSRRRSFVGFHVKNFWTRTDTKAAANTVTVYEVTHLTPPVSSGLPDKSPFHFVVKAPPSGFLVYIRIHCVASDTLLCFYSFFIITTS